jgi:alpha-L-rhamnosidase
VSVHWDAASLTVEVPFGATAEVHVPFTGRVPREARFLRQEPGFRVYEVPTGRWRFTS